MGGLQIVVAAAWWQRCMPGQAAAQGKHRACVNKSVLACSAFWARHLQTQRPARTHTTTHRGGYVMAAFFVVGAPSAMLVRAPHGRAAAACCPVRTVSAQPGP